MRKDSKVEDVESAKTFFINFFSLGEKWKMETSLVDRVRGRSLFPTFFTFFLIFKLISFAFEKRKGIFDHWAKKYEKLRIFDF